jgi:lysophospholipase L1-like esterase
MKLKTSIRSRTGRALTAALATTLIAALAAAGGAALPAKAATGVDYAALGDSYSSGVGAGSYDPASGTCYRGSNSYPTLWKKGHAVAKYTFVACSGATTADVLNTQISALPSTANLVTVTVGGNDAGFVDLVATCKIASAKVCSAAASVAVAYVRTVLPTKLTSTYAAIKAAAPNARLVVLGYPRLFEEVGLCGVFSMTPANRVSMNAAADALDTVIKSQAEGSGASFVDVRSAFSGHGACASTAWINGLVLVNTQNSYHPTAAGYSSGYLPALTAVTG